VDECGDLGFSDKATKFFVVGFVISHNPWEYETHFKRLLKDLRVKHHYKHDELKFSRADEEERCIILKNIIDKNILFGFIILQKSKVHQHLREDKNLLYRYVVIDPLMEMILPFLEERGKLVLKIDRSIFKEQIINDFNKYVELKGYYYSKKTDRFTILYRHQITIEHEDSQKEVGIQLADCLAASEFHRFEERNYAYHNIIYPKEREELWRFLW
jgi:hypothetical protein